VNPNPASPCCILGPSCYYGALEHASGWARDVLAALQCSHPFWVQFFEGTMVGKGSIPWIYLLSSYMLAYRYRDIGAVVIKVISFTMFCLLMPRQYMLDIVVRVTLGAHVQPFTANYVHHN